MMSVSSWPARPTNGSPCRSSSRPGGFADEHEIGGGTADAEDDVGAGRGQAAGSADVRFASHGVERFEERRFGKGIVGGCHGPRGDGWCDGRGRGDRLYVAGQIEVGVAQIAQESQLAQDVVIHCGDYRRSDGGERFARALPSSAFGTFSLDPEGRRRRLTGQTPRKTPSQSRDARESLAFSPPQRGEGAEGG